MAKLSLLINRYVLCGNFYKQVFKQKTIVCGYSLLFWLDVDCRLNAHFFAQMFLYFVGNVVPFENCHFGRQFYMESKFAMRSIVVNMEMMRLEVAANCFGNYRIDFGNSFVWNILPH